MRAVALLLVLLPVLPWAGCGAVVQPAPVAVTATPTPRPQAAPAAPTSGWASHVVAVGNGAYVVGRHRDDSAALWWVDARGRLSARTPPPGTPGPRDRGVRDPELAFVGPDSGLAVTGTEGDTALFVTADGARTWRPVVLRTRDQPDQVAVGGGAAYVVTSDCGGAAPACDHATVWSIDPASGSVHTSDTLPRAPAGGAQTAVGAFGDHVWVALGLGSGRTRSLHSDDGGRTWRRLDGGPCRWEHLVPTSASVLWSTCGTGMQAHVTRQAGSTTSRWLFGGEVGGTSACMLLPLDDSTAYAVVPDRDVRRYGNRLAITRDGGRTYRVVATIPRGFVRQGFRVALATMQIGFLVTDAGGELYRTTDGGRRWEPVRAPS